VSSLELSVSDFVAVFNQSIDYAYPQVTIIGELSNFKISKNRWVYFDLKDDQASVRFFGTTFQLPGPLENGMMLRVVGSPQLHPQFGFSITVKSIQAAGDGSIKKAAQLLQAKLQKEGLFDAERKRLLPHPPHTIGLIASEQSAGYADFIKILQARWPKVIIDHYDVQVQGDGAPTQIIAAINYFNARAEVPEVLVITRGGGSSDDLQAFSNEAVTRAVAASRIPTLVAIGHEVDSSLAELAADLRASTPSNAAELLVPEKKQEMNTISEVEKLMKDFLQRMLKNQQRYVFDKKTDVTRAMQQILQAAKQNIAMQRQILSMASPQHILQRGYAIVRSNGNAIASARKVLPQSKLTIEFKDGTVDAKSE